MMRHFSFFHPDTGAVVDRVFGADCEDHNAAVKANTPDGHFAIEGKLDPLSHRVAHDGLDSVTGVPINPRVEDYQPPQPQGCDWDAVVRRWVPGAALCAAENAQHEREGQRAVLAAREYALMRQLALDPTDTAARAQLSAIDTQLTKLAQ